MRKHRGAIAVIFLFITALIWVFPAASAGNPAIPQQGDAPPVWTSSVQYPILWPKNLWPRSTISTPAPSRLSAPALSVSPTSTGLTSPPTTTTSTPVTSVAAPSATEAADVPLSGGLWPCIIQAESSGNASDTSGLYGILISTWRSLYGAVPDAAAYGVPGAAPIHVQNEEAMHLYEEYGWRPWNDSCTGR